MKYTHTHKEIQEVVLSSTKSARCSGDHLPGDTRSSLSSTHFVSDRLLLGIGVLGYHAVQEVQRGVQQRIRKDGGQVASEAVGSTARPAAELAVRHRHVIAHSRVLDMSPRDRTCVLLRTHILHALVQRAGQSQADSRVLLGLSLFVYPTYTFVATV